VEEGTLVADEVELLFGATPGGEEAASGVELHRLGRRGPGGERGEEEEEREELGLQGHS
jgi:hypothetical protein